MIAVIGIILVASWFASSASKRGFNPILWGLLGAACYWVSTFVATLIIGFLVKLLPLANEVKAFIQIMGLVFNIAIGLGFCYWLGRQFGFKAD